MRGPGRPPLDDEHRRDEPLTVRLTRTELNLLKIAAARSRQDLSAWARSVLKRAASEVVAARVPIASLALLLLLACSPTPEQTETMPAAAGETSPMDVERGTQADRVAFKAWLERGDYDGGRINRFKDTDLKTRRYFVTRRPVEPSAAVWLENPVMTDRHLPTIPEAGAPAVEVHARWQELPHPEPGKEWPPEEIERNLRELEEQTEALVAWCRTTGKACLWTSDGMGHPNRWSLARSVGKLPPWMGGEVFLDRASRRFRTSSIREPADLDPPEQAWANQLKLGCAGGHRPAAHPKLGIDGQWWTINGEKVTVRMGAHTWGWPTRTDHDLRLYFRTLAKWGCTGTRGWIVEQWSALDRRQDALWPWRAEGQRPRYHLDEPSPAWQAHLRKALRIASEEGLVVFLTVWSSQDHRQLAARGFLPDSPLWPGNHAREFFAMAKPRARDYAPELFSPAHPSALRKEELVRVVSAIAAEVGNAAVTPLNEANGSQNIPPAVVADNVRRLGQVVGEAWR